MKLINYNELLNEKNYILIDVRSPQEFMLEGISGAINIPILLDDERAEVGTAYKQTSPESAKILGIGFISKRLPEIFQEINALSKKYKKIIFYCARGGMRSGSISSLFASLGYKVFKLNGGYKSYREYILKEIPVLNEGVKYVIIHGKTGVGKTKLLNSLENKGFSVLDLERMADHKGSFFGGLCEKRPQSQKRFESLLYDFFSKNNPKYVIAESESKRIGNVYVPESIYHSLLQGEHILADTTIEHRIKIVMEDYTNTDKKAIEECILKLQRYASKEYVSTLLQLLEEGNLPEISKLLMTDYYDSLYQKSIDKYDFENVAFYEDIPEGTEKVIAILEKFGITNKIEEEPVETIEETAEKIENTK